MLQPLVVARSRGMRGINLHNEVERMFHGLVGSVSPTSKWKRDFRDSLSLSEIREGNLKTLCRSGGECPHHYHSSCDEGNCVLMAQIENIDNRI